MNKKEQKAAHQAPSTPGWQLLVEAAQAAISGHRKADLELLLAHLVARRDEFIPEQYRQQVVTTVAAAGSKFFLLHWDPVFSEFLEAQLGKEGLRKLLAGSGYEIEDYPGFYLITNSNPDPELVAELQEAEAYFQASLLGFIMGSSQGPQEPCAN